jgi:hypothetical protein
MKVSKSFFLLGIVLIFSRNLNAQEIVKIQLLKSIYSNEANADSVDAPMSLDSLDSDAVSEESMVMDTFQKDIEAFRSHYLIKKRTSFFKKKSNLTDEDKRINGNYIYRKQFIKENTADPAVLNTSKEFAGAFPDRLKNSFKNSKYFEYYLDRFFASDVDNKLLMNAYINFGFYVDYKIKNTSIDSAEYIDILRINRNYYGALIDKKLDDLTTNYTNNKDGGKKELVKSVRVMHVNDFLSAILIPNNKMASLDNDDRALTGGLDAEVTTDYFGLRFIPTTLWPSRYMSYSSIGLSARAYTPSLDSLEEDMRWAYKDVPIAGNINNLETIDSFRVDQFDQPYAFHSYFFLNQYKLRTDGRVRLKTSIRLGVFGGAVGEAVQDAIHQDILIGTKSAYGWNSQIAAGNRISLNVYHKRERLWKSEYLESKNWKRKRGLYLNTYWDGNLGHEKNTLGVGAELSTKDFFEQLPTGELTKHIGWYNNHEIDFNFTLFGHVERVFRNSYYEGYGLFQDADLDDDKETPVDVYSLEAAHVNNVVFRYGFSFSLRVYKATLKYDWIRISNEFEFDNVNRELGYKERAEAVGKTYIPENTWGYHYGQISLTFKL